MLAVLDVAAVLAVAAVVVAAASSSGFVSDAAAPGIAALVATHDASARACEHSALVPFFCRMSVLRLAVAALFVEARRPPWRGPGEGRLYPHRAPLQSGGAPSRPEWALARGVPRSGRSGAGRRLGGGANNTGAYWWVEFHSGTRDVWKGASAALSAGVR